MIRFVDLRPADIVGFRFAFWDTVENRFVEFNGDQAWETMWDFQDSCRSGDAVESFARRLTGLAPEWAREPSPEPDTPSKRVVFGFEDIDKPQEWVDACRGLTDQIANSIDEALEKILREIGIEKVAYIAYPPPPNPSMKRQIIGHGDKCLGEVWIEWSDPKAAGGIMVKAKYYRGKDEEITDGG